MRLYEIAASKIKTHLEYHKTLNPKLWKKEGDTYVLDPEVMSALDDITDSFIDKLGVKKNQILDVVLTGSNCNYNWSKLSDIDLHVILDYKKICPTCKSKDEFDIDDCFKAKKSVWNDGHDVTIRGITVEVYAQSEEEKPSSNAGLYSLKHAKWINEPIYDEEIVYDEKEIQRKAKKVMDEIDDLIADKSTTWSKVLKLQEKLKKIRRASIARGGEFSLENLVHKTIRNNGYIDKLYDFAAKIESEELSLK